MYFCFITFKSGYHPLGTAAFIVITTEKLSYLKVNKDVDANLSNRCKVFAKDFKSNNVLQII